MKSEQLKTKVALVSRSSMGIGKAIAMELVFQGAQVVLNGRNPEKSHNTETELRRMRYEVTTFIADVRHPSKCEYLINETVKPIDNWIF